MWKQNDSTQWTSESNTVCKEEQTCQLISPVQWVQPRNTDIYFRYFIQSESVILTDDKLFVKTFKVPLKEVQRNFTVKYQSETNQKMSARSQK